MKSISVSILLAIQSLLGGVFQSCVEKLPPKQAQTTPRRLAQNSDQIWQWLARNLSTEIREKREAIRDTVLTEKKRLKITLELPEPYAGEKALKGTYGQLPEIYTDTYIGAIFPLPVSPPQRFSWYQVGIAARHELNSLSRYQLEVDQWIKSQPASSKTTKTVQFKQFAKFENLVSQWILLNQEYISLNQQIRYLEEWIPQLEKRLDADSKNGTETAIEGIIHAIFTEDSRLFETLAEILRPRRLMKRSFLPDNLKTIPDGLVRIPIATDIRDRKFLAEMKGALDTHWNQSFWAKSEGIKFQIDWHFVPKNLSFASDRETLEQHLAHFPVNEAIMTTGGLTTYVHQQALILGPGSTNPRTLAHELGHLMGFGDCYLRTLTSQGIFGVAILEWDNPLYPDDIMCDNTDGEPRVETW